MGAREKARGEARFARGEVGVDGAATEEKQDQAELEKGKAREQYLRGKAYLGREFLTWLLWKSESGDPLAEVDGESVVVLFTGKIGLRGIAGEVTELSAKGAMAPYSVLVRQSLDRGLLLHGARLRLTCGERVYEVSLEADWLDVKSAKLPELLSEQEDDRLTERLWLSEKLAAILDALLAEFLKVRATRRWSKDVVPQLKAWMRGEVGSVAFQRTALATPRVAGRLIWDCLDAKSIGARRREPASICVQATARSRAANTTHHQ
jgi:hypothetical protein